MNAQRADPVAGLQARLAAIHHGDMPLAPSHPVLPYLPTPAPAKQAKARGSGSSKKSTSGGRAKKKVALDSDGDDSEEEDEDYEGEESAEDTDGRQKRKPSFGRSIAGAITSNKRAIETHMETAKAAQANLIALRAILDNKFKTGGILGTGLVSREIAYGDLSLTA